MKKIKNRVVKIGIFFLFMFLIFYFLFLFILPKFLSSNIFLNLINDTVAKKTGIVIKSEKLKVNTYPALVIIIAADKLNLTSGNDELLRIKNASLIFDLKKLKPKKAEIEYIYLNQMHIQNIIKTSNNKKSNKFNFKNFPEIFVKKAEIWLDKGKINSIFINIDNFKIKNENEKAKLTFDAEIISNLLMNLVQIGRNGYLYIKNNELYAENIELLIGVSKINLNGKITDKNKKSDFTIKGDNIPISDTTSAILYFQKIKDNNKKFMENFYDYSGNLNIDLNVTENGVFGNCNAINLAGKTVLFDVPILFKNVPFKFNGKSFSAGAYGTLGGEKVYADFSLTDTASLNQEAKGTVQSVLTDKSVGKYVPYASIKGSTDVSVNWHIKNKKIDIIYNVFIPVNSDIYYKNANLGIEDKVRNLFVNTVKFGDKLKITDYSYSIIDNGIKQRIIMGDGLFTKNNGHLEPDYITCKTENDAPVSVAGSFYKYLKGGVFGGNLKYDFNKNKITGDFNIKNSIYKNYYIEKASVSALNEKITVEANGKYNHSDFKANITGLNNFDNKIKIYNLDLFLDELVVKSSKNKNQQMKIDEKTIKEHTDDFEIDIYKIKLNKIKYKKALLTDIIVTGSIQNNIFNFNVNNINFAKGNLKANGFYDFNNRKSDVSFFADNIDSNIAAGSLFNLPNQVQGKAKAILKIKTKNGIDDRCGNIKFTIKDGYLPKLGSTEFIIKQSKLIKKPIKFTIQDIINIDIKNMKALASDINGTFDVDNGYIKNAHITSSQKYLSLLLLGDYNTVNQQADLHLFGKYNNKQVSKIKIFFVPLSFIVKIMFRTEKTFDKYQKELNAVPPIYTDTNEDLSAFRVKINGNINENDVKVEMKSIL